jgi:hypothetical protein
MAAPQSNRWTMGAAANRTYTTDGTYKWYESNRSLSHGREHARPEPPSS